jgi:hypothetical protein
VGSVGYTTTVVLDTNGDVTSIEGASCTTCSLYVDSGFVLSGSLYISGTVFYDASGPGETDDTYTAGDSPYANISVFLYDQERRIIGITETDANGQYTFTNLFGHATNGVTYTVSFDDGALQVAGMDVTAAGVYEVENYHTVVLYSTSVTDVDFGLYEEIDFGDLEDEYGTTVAVEGAGHISGTLYLGISRDTEGDGAPTPLATGDGGDEDGVSQINPSNWSPGTDQSISVVVTGDNGRLYGYYDWNDDGDFADAGETVNYGSVPEGTHYFSVTIPASADTVNVRFRLFDSTQSSYYASTGLSTNGEVEDYQWNANPTAVTLSLFEAEWQEGAVRVTWETALEIDTVGFNVWRSTSPNGAYEQVNATLIPAASLGGVWGGSYEIVDTDVFANRVYYYKLEELEVGGKRNWYGPASTGDSENPTAVELFKVAASGSTASIWLLAGAVAALSLPPLLLVRLWRRRR